MTLKQRLEYQLTLSRYQVLVNSTDGAFSIPKGFEGIWTDRAAFFDAVKAQAIFNINQIYALDQLARMDETDISDEDYAILEEAVARYIDIATGSAVFKERLNAYSIQLEQGYKYDAKDIKLIKPNDALPRTIVGALNNTAIRPQIEAYDIRGAYEEADTSSADEPWKFADNGLAPEDLNWGDKADALDLSRTEQALAEHIADYEEFKQDVDDAVVNLTKTVVPFDIEENTASKAVLNGTIISKELLTLATQDDKEFAQVKAVKDAVSEFRTKDGQLQAQINANKAEADAIKAHDDAQDSQIQLNKQQAANNLEAITQNKALLDAVKAHDDAQDIKIAAALADVKSVEENLQAISDTVGDIVLYEGALDHSDDKDGTVSGTDKTFSIPYKQYEDPNNAGATYIPQRIASGNKIVVLVYDTASQQMSNPIHRVVGATSATTFNVDGKTLKLSGIQDLGTASQNFQLKVSTGTNGQAADLQGIKIHEVILDQAQVSGQALTQVIADARYTKKSGAGVIGGTTGKGTSDDVIQNLAENWAAQAQTQQAVDTLNTQKIVLGDKTTEQNLQDIPATVKHASTAYADAVAADAKTAAQAAAATDATTKANAAQAAAIADAAAKDTALHTTITTETDNKLALKQDKITTTTITIPEQIIYRTQLFSNNDRGSNTKTLSIDIGDNWVFDKIITYIPTTIEDSGDSKNYGLRSSSDTQWTYDYTNNNNQPGQSGVSINTQTKIATITGGAWKVGNGYALSIQYKKTIPEQTFKVIA